jgi:hypothetical protein
MKLSPARTSVARHLGAAGLVALVAAASGAGGCGNDEGVVGGSCAPGYVDCNNQCIRVTSDPDNCGACGNVCPSGMCVGGSCTSVTDARPPRGDAGKDARSDGPTKDGMPTFDGPLRDVTVHDGMSPDVHADGVTPDSPVDGRPEGAPSDAPVTDGKSHDGGTDAGDTGPVDAGVDQCAPPYITTEHCGTCATACTTGNICSPPAADAGLGAPYQCAPMCAMPFTACAAVCVNVLGDPDNCGSCGHICPSGICTNGVCEGATLGDIVIIGHDYAAANVLVSEAQILSNAVFLPPTNPLRVLSYEQYADPTQVAHVKATLAAYKPLGRSITYTVEDQYTSISTELTTASFDVLLVYDQADAPASMLGMVGSTLAMPLASFVAVGGDVVVLDGASGINQMASFLTQSNLLQTQGETPVPDTDRLVVVAPGDGVGNFVISPYAPIADTVYFVTTESNGGKVTYVVDDLTAGLLPVVIHKTP